MKFFHTFNSAKVEFTLRNYEIFAMPMSYGILNFEFRHFNKSEV